MFAGSLGFPEIKTRCARPCPSPRKSNEIGGIRDRQAPDIFGEPPHNHAPRARYWAFPLPCGEHWLEVSAREAEVRAGPSHNCFPSSPEGRRVHRSRTRAPWPSPPVPGIPRKQDIEIAFEAYSLR